MLPKKETMTVEFKSDLKGLPDHELVDESVAMANSEGGTIYIGIEDDGRPTGAKDYHTDVDGLRALIANKTVPSLFVSPTLIYEDGVPVVAVEVPVSEYIVATSGGKVLQRRIKGDGSPEMSPFYPWEYESRRSYLHVYDPSAAVVVSYNEDYLDTEAIELAQKRLALSPQADQALVGLSKEDFLGAIGARKTAMGEPMLTMTGLLLFGREQALRKYAPSVGFCFQQLHLGQVVQNHSLVSNIIRVYPLFDRFCETFNFSDEIFSNGRRIDIPYFDKRALREGFANAIAHRDYNLLGEIRVQADESGLTLSNPGSLVRGLHVEDLLMAEPRGRNPLLSSALKRLGYCESTGRGVDTIFYGAAMYGKLWPTYNVSQDNVISLFFPRCKPVASISICLLEQGENLPMIAVMLLSLCVQKPGRTLLSLAQEIHIQKERIVGFLTLLLNRGFLRMDESRYYPCVAEVPTKGVTISEEEAIQKIILSAKDNGGTLNNQLVQEALHVNADKAYSYLKTMLQKGLIVLLQRGKYASYKLRQD